MSENCIKKNSNNVVANMISLLGGRKDIVELFRNRNGFFTEKDLEFLSSYNFDLEVLAKDRLANCSTISVSVLN